MLFPAKPRKAREFLYLYWKKERDSGKKKKETINRGGRVWRRRTRGGDTGQVLNTVVEKELLTGKRKKRKKGSILCRQSSSISEACNGFGNFNAVLGEKEVRLKEKG